MKLLIAGSRSIVDYGLIDALLWDIEGISEIVSGCARGGGGVDQLGEAWAARNGIPVVRFPADWDRFGKAAGVYRNAAYCDCGMILWDGISVGTVDMIDKLRRAGKPYEVWDDLGLWVSGFIKTCE